MDTLMQVIEQEHRETVAAVQQQQMRLTLALVKQAGIKQVFQEGLVAEELAAYRSASLTSRCAEAVQQDN